MEALILPNSLFDDGSIDCKTFCVATADDGYVCDYSIIRRDYAEFIPRIVEAMSQNKDPHYIKCTDGKGDYFEIQWD